MDQYHPHHSIYSTHHILSYSRKYSLMLRMFHSELHLLEHSFFISSIPCSFLLKINPRLTVGLCLITLSKTTAFRTHGRLHAESRKMKKDAVLDTLIPLPSYLFSPRARLLLGLHVSGSLFNFSRVN